MVKMTPLFGVDFFFIKWTKKNFHQDTNLLPGLRAKKWVVNEIPGTVTEVHAKKWVVFRFAQTVSHL